MNIIPQPNKVTLLGGKMALGKNTKIICQDSQLKDSVAKALAKFDNKSSNSVEFVTDSAMAKEEYSIVAKADKVEVKASGFNGFFYAAQTLSQMLDGDGAVECVTICDKPRFEYRSFMLDCARHFWTIEKIKQYIDLMASVKLNIFHWHLSEDQGWRAEIKKYPLLTTKGCIRKDTPLSLKGYPTKREEHDGKEYGRGLFYSQEQMRDIVDYASKRAVEVVPEIDMPGHLVSAISCYPELSCTGEKVEVSNRWGVMDNIGCCGKENIYQFAKDIVDELVDIFPCKYFHIGGDEVPKNKWKTCPKCQAKIKELGLANENELQGYFNNVMADYLSSKGKTTLGWNEILESSKTLNKNIIPQWWTRHIGSRYELDWIDNGGKLVISMVDFVYMDHPYMKRPLAKTYSFAPSKIGIKNESGVLGVEAPQWTEYIRDERKLDFNTVPRMCAIAEVGWTQETNMEYDDFERRFESKRDKLQAQGLVLPSQKVYRGNACWNPFKIRDIGMAKWVVNPYFELEKDGK
ncbi:MAG: beta-N-acetylhexosaminidase [Clostridia bacterium]